MLTARALLVPHLPTLLVDAHRGHETEMLKALAAESRRLGEEKPDACVVVSARWGAPGPFLVDAGKRHQTLTDYSGFGVEVRYDCPGHTALARALVEAGLRAGLRVSATNRGVDSGVSVPMHFLFPNCRVRVVPLSISDRAPPECVRWGATLRSTLAAWPERVAFVVGGMLSHHRHAWKLGRDVPEAREFDESALSALARGAWDELRAAARRLGERAQPEAGMRHLELLRGFLGSDAPGRLLCYEPGPGVGAAFLEFEVPQPAAGPA
jgi:aromatic ring-opening dioxygenase catalytic subunit (LigB family)